MDAVSDWKCLVDEVCGCRIHRRGFSTTWRLCTGESRVEPTSLSTAYRLRITWLQSLPRYLTWDHILTELQPSLLESTGVREQCPFPQESLFSFLTQFIYFLAFPSLPCRRTRLNLALVFKFWLYVICIYQDLSVGEERVEVSAWILLQCFDTADWAAVRRSCL